MSGRYGQLTTVLQRLGDGLALVNPVRLVSVAREALRELGTPPPGDPAALRALAAAFRAAAGELGPLDLEVRRLPAPEARSSGAGGDDPGSHTAEAWQRPDATAAAGPPPASGERPAAGWRSGLAGASFAEVTNATANAVGRSPEAFTAAAAALDALAEQIEEQRRRHGELRARLREALHDATHLGAVPARDPSALDDLTVATTRLIRGGVRVYTEAIEAADTAAAVFADVAGAARAGAVRAGAVRAGAAHGAEVSAVDAVVLAEQGVRVGGYDGGVLTVAQLRRAGQRLAAMAEPDATTVRTVIDDARSGTERAYLFKALAAGHDATDLAAFAGTIRGRDDAWLHNHLTLIDRGGPGAQDRFGAEVDQYDEYTCGTTSAIVALAEADPAYALSLTGGLEPPYDQADREEFDRRLTAEQRRVHDATNVVWPERLGTLPAGIAGWLNGHAAATGTRYLWHLVDDTDRRAVSTALREVAAAADGGHPAPVLVGGPVPRHYVLVVGHAGDDLLIFEPTSGDTRRVPAADFVGGTLAGETGFNHVQAVIVPRQQP